MVFMGGILGGRPERVMQTPLYTPQQEAVLNQLLGGAQQQLPQGFEFLQNILSQNPQAMQAYERPALRQFEEQILPTIAERFTGDYGTGSSRSSAFGQQLGQAGAGLAENLQAQRAGLGFQGLQGLLQLLSGGLGERTQRTFRPSQPGLLTGLLQNLVGGTTTGVGYGIGQAGSSGLASLLGLG